MKINADGDGNKERLRARKREAAGRRPWERQGVAESDGERKLAVAKNSGSLLLRHQREEAHMIEQ